MEVHEIYQIAELISACIRGEILPAEKQQILDRWIKARKSEIIRPLPALPFFRTKENSRKFI